ncbi:hypothetical protein EZV61_09610 [Corallincola luteus]|uniref:Uncharacterized protein n=1 Tax=Corallincola luteus TaxID=1775177 RepID=A0ABY2ALQ6_9GAMM|nr:hypothetical protein [Corallincola luteus]TCI03140.1 hypothetical protein EZV61_09610 [Corallincola luteus]
MTDIVKLTFTCREQDISHWKGISELLAQGKSGVFLQDMLDELAPNAGDLLEELFEKVGPSEFYAEYYKQDNTHFMIALLAGNNGAFVAKEMRRLLKALPVTKTRVTQSCDDAL